jgi:hypothetical protein
MPCDFMPYKAYIGRGREEGRPRGGPRVRWIGGVRETLPEHQMTIVEAARKAKTR